MARLPQISAALLAEQLRPEIGNKMTILGYFGVSPYVVLTVPSTPCNLNLAALFNFVPYDRDEKFVPEISVEGPQSTILSRRDSPEVVTVVKDKPGFLAVTFMGIPVEKLGRYRICIYDEGKVHYELSFEVELPPAG